MNPILYQLTNVVQRYNGRCVLRIPHMTVHRGEILALVGPSGAGKSTLLRLLNFLEPPAAGTIEFEGSAVNGRAPLSLRRRVTTVFQSPNLLNRSVAANLQYGLSLRGQKLSKNELAAWLARLGLDGLANQAARTLSAGEAQRVALARALVTRPHVLLLDEPTANLDPQNVALIESLIRQENAERETTIVLVTHNVFQARRLAQRTALLLNGRLVELSDSDTFFNNPRAPETAAFLRGDLIF